MPTDAGCQPKDHAVKQAFNSLLAEKVLELKVGCDSWIRKRLLAHLKLSLEMMVHRNS